MVQDTARRYSRADHSVHIAGPVCVKSPTRGPAPSPVADPSSHWQRLPHSGTEVPRNRLDTAPCKRGRRAHQRDCWCARVRRPMLNMLCQVLCGFANHLFRLCVNVRRGIMIRPLIIHSNCIVGLGRQQTKGGCETIRAAKLIGLNRLRLRLFKGDSDSGLQSTEYPIITRTNGHRCCPLPIKDAVVKFVLCDPRLSILNTIPSRGPVTTRATSSRSSKQHCFSQCWECFSSGSVDVV